MPRELVDAALLAVDHADRSRHAEPRLAERRDRLDRRPAGGDDVLDEADALALGVDAAAASATAPSSGPASLAAAGSCSDTAAAIALPSGASRSGRVSKRYLSR
jgi:hypothetical protein